MIYNDKFVWLHFPKCAGTKIESLFANYLANEQEIIQDKVNPVTDPSASWHNSLTERSARDPNFKLNGRVVVCSIRRLPYWLESRYNYEYKRSPELPHNPKLILEGKFLERGGYLNHADYYIEKYLPESLLSSARIKFLRMEYFETDFVDIFGEFLDLSNIPCHEYDKKINCSSSYLPEEILNNLLTNNDIYNKCPKWALIESLAYK